MAKLNKKFARMSNAKLNALLQSGIDEISAKAIRDILEVRGTLQADKYAVIKKIGNFGTIVIREFDDIDKAKNFVALLREFEKRGYYTVYTCKTCKFLTI